MKKTYRPARLIKWFATWLAVTFLVSLSFLEIFSITLSNSLFSRFLAGFILGFLICASVATFVYFKTLGLIGKAIRKVRAITEGNMDLKYEDSFTQEPGEFYEFYKNLNKINSELKLQKEIINKESSELEAVISAVRGAIVAVDENQKILFFNQEATLFFKTNKKPSQGIFLSELIRSPDILKCYEECLTQGKIVEKKIEISFFETDEQEDTTYEISVAPLKGENDKIQGAVGLFYDITNLKKTEKLHIDFISNVSHELRTPLTAIQGYVQTLLLELKNNNMEVMEKFLGIINRNVERLVSLLNHFLELSHLEASMRLKKETLSTEEITRSIIRDLHIKKHELKCDFSAKEVRADPHLLKQVLYNLLDNARMYVPEGRLIEVLWKREDSQVVLTVKDDGEGIHRRHRDRIFEKFYRVDQARTKKSNRVSGIGLSIVKSLVEKHGGQVKLISEESQGSQFICSFPDD